MATQSGPAHGAPAHAFPLAGVTDAPPRTTLALIAALGLTALLAPAAAADDDDLPIALGDVVAGSLDVTTEVDRFTFTAPAGQVVYLDRIDTDNPFGLNWSLQDAHGRALLGSTTQLPDLGPVTLMGGEYSVVISGEQHQVGTYEFAVRDATPDALVLPLYTEVGDEISQPGQIDRWTYTASPGEQVVLDFLTSSNANNHHTGMAFSNQAGWKYSAAAITTASAATQANRTVRLTLPIIAAHSQPARIKNTPATMANGRRSSPKTAPSTIGSSTSAVITRSFNIIVLHSSWSLPHRSDQSVAGGQQNPVTLHQRRQRQNLATTTVRNTVHCKPVATTKSCLFFDRHRYGSANPAAANPPWTDAAPWTPR